MNNAEQLKPSMRCEEALAASSIDSTPLASFDGQRVRMRRLRQKFPDPVFVEGSIDHTLIFHIGSSPVVERREDGRVTGCVDTLRSTTILPAGRGAAWRAPDTVDVIHTYVDDTVLRRFAEEDLGVPGHTVEVLDLIGVEDEFMRSFAPVLLHELQSDLPSSKLMLDSLDMVVAGHILRAYSNVGDRVRNALVKAPPALSPEMLARAREIIEAGIEDGVEAETVAAEVGLSRYHFLRCFKQAMGMTPHAYLLQRRIEHAQSLLLATADPLSEIGYACGFSSQSHFSTTFRRIAGTTPGEFRQAHRN